MVAGNGQADPLVESLVFFQTGDDFRAVFSIYFIAEIQFKGVNQTVSGKQGLIPKKLILIVDEVIGERRFNVVEVVAFFVLLPVAVFGRRNQFYLFDDTWRLFACLEIIADDFIARLDLRNVLVAKGG